MLQVPSVDALGKPVVYGVFLLWNVSGRNVAGVLGGRGGAAMTHPYNPLTNRPALTVLIEAAEEEDGQTLRAALYKLCKADLDALERVLEMSTNTKRGKKDDND